MQAGALRAAYGSDKLTTNDIKPFVGTDEYANGIPKITGKRSLIRVASFRFDMKGYALPNFYTANTNAHKLLIMTTGE